MRTDEALTQYRNYGELVPVITLLERMASPRSVLLLSPAGEDYRLWRAVFPRARILVYTVHDWDLGTPPPPGIGRFDLCIAQNVFMYARQPAQWFEHLSRVGRHLLIQDLVYRRRSGTAPYLGTDGDAIRYDLGVASEPRQPTFELSTVPIRRVHFHRFSGYGNAFHAADDGPVHFVWLGDTGLEVPDPAASFGLRRTLYELGAHAFRSPFVLRVYKILRRLLA